MWMVSEAILVDGGRCPRPSKKGYPDGDRSEIGKNRLSTGAAAVQ
jgi:hypothetical protein